MIKTRLSSRIVRWQRKYLIQRDGERCRICGKRQDELPHVLEVAHINGDPYDNRESNLCLMCKPCNIKDKWRLYHERIRKQRPVRSPSSEMLRQLKEMHGRKVAYRQSGATVRETIPAPAIDYPPIIDLSKMGSEHPTNDDESTDKLPKVARQDGVSPSVCVREKISDAATGVEKESMEGGDGRYDDRVLHTEDESPEMRESREKEPEFREWCFNQLWGLDGRPMTLTVHDAIYSGAEAVGLSPVTTRRYLAKLVSKEGPFRIGEGERGHQEILLREDYL